MKEFLLSMKCYVGPFASAQSVAINSVTVAAVDQVMAGSPEQGTGLLTSKHLRTLHSGTSSLCVRGWVRPRTLHSTFG